jgi:NAD(P)-dependent dehydrogenase (short-subunit alcohol dehydrogenase family)
MTRRAAIVTGGLRGLGKAMTFGLAQAGHSVLAVGHLSEDVEGSSPKPRRDPSDAASCRSSPTSASLRNATVWSRPRSIHSTRPIFSSTARA